MKKVSTWLSAYSELEELTKLYKEKKISEKEFESRKSEIEKRVKAARRLMHGLVKNK